MTSYHHHACTVYSSKLTGIHIWTRLKCQLNYRDTFLYIHSYLYTYVRTYVCAQGALYDMCIYAKEKIIQKCSLAPALENYFAFIVRLLTLLRCADLFAFFKELQFADCCCELEIF